MSLFQNLKKKLFGTLCKNCNSEVKEIGRQLYMLPMSVGNYESHYKDPDYYRQNLRKVACKAEIPTGIYACGAIIFQCPQCGLRKVHLSIFLPVREEEKYEEIICFEDGELDSFLWQ